MAKKAFNEVSAAEGGVYVLAQVAGLSLGLATGSTLFAIAGVLFPIPIYLAVQAKRTAKAKAKTQTQRPRR